MAKTTLRIDYLEMADKASGLAPVPWGGNFRKIAGNKIVGHRVFRYRVIAVLIALLLFGTGLWFVIF